MTPLITIMIAATLYCLAVYFKDKKWSQSQVQKATKAVKHGSKLR